MCAHTHTHTHTHTQHPSQFVVILFCFMWAHTHTHSHTASFSVCCHSVLFYVCTHTLTHTHSQRPSQFVVILFCFMCAHTHTHTVSNPVIIEPSAGKLSSCNIAKWFSYLGISHGKWEVTNCNSCGERNRRPRDAGIIRVMGLPSFISQRKLLCHSGLVIKRSTQVAPGFAYLQWWVSLIGRGV
jgi:hypothetical protein